MRVEEDEVGDYRIEIRVILKFGVELAAVAGQVQQRIAEQIEKMTSKNVARVNVVIDGVRTEEKSNAKAKTGKPTQINSSRHNSGALTYDEQEDISHALEHLMQIEYLYIAGGAHSRLPADVVGSPAAETDRRI